MRYRTIGGLMALVGVVACGLVSLRHATPLMAGVVCNSTLFLLVFGALRARFASDPGARSWWFGFSLVGGANFVVMIIFEPYNFINDFVPMYLLPLYMGSESHWLLRPSLMPGDLIDSNAPQIWDRPPPVTRYISQLLSQDFSTIVHACLGMYTSLVIGWLGGTLTGYLDRRQGRRQGRVAEAPCNAGSSAG
jgi:hypothetical protein